MFWGDKQVPAWLYVSKGELSLLEFCDGKCTVVAAVPLGARPDADEAYWLDELSTALATLETARTRAPEYAVLFSGALCRAFTLPQAVRTDVAPQARNRMAEATARNAAFEDAASPWSSPDWSYGVAMPAPLLSALKRLLGRRLSSCGPWWTHDALVAALLDGTPLVLLTDCDGVLAFSAGVTSTALVSKAQWFATDAPALQRLKVAAGGRFKQVQLHELGNTAEPAPRISLVRAFPRRERLALSVAAALVIAGLWFGYCAWQSYRDTARLERDVALVRLNQEKQQKARQDAALEPAFQVDAAGWAGAASLDIPDALSTLEALVRPGVLATRVSADETQGVIAELEVTPEALAQLLEQLAAQAAAGAPTWEVSSVSLAAESKLLSSGTPPPPPALAPVPGMPLPPYVPPLPSGPAIPSGKTKVALKFTTERR